MITISDSLSGLLIAWQLKMSPEETWEIINYFRNTVSLSDVNKKGRGRGVDGKVSVSFVIGFKYMNQESRKLCNFI